MLVSGTARARETGCGIVRNSESTCFGCDSTAVLTVFENLSQPRLYCWLHVTCISVSEHSLYVGSRSDCTVVALQDDRNWEGATQERPGSEMNILY